MLLALLMAPRAGRRPRQCGAQAFFAMMISLGLLGRPVPSGLLPSWPSAAMAATTSRDGGVHGAEDRVVGCLVQAGRVVPDQEELRAVGAGPGVGHRDHPADVGLGAVGLVGELVAGSALPGAGRIPALQHEDAGVGQPVAAGLVEVALAGQRDERVDRARRLGPVQGDRDLALGHLQHVLTVPAGRHPGGRRRVHRLGGLAGRDVLADVLAGRRRVLGGQRARRASPAGRRWTRRWADPAAAGQQHRARTASRTSRRRGKRHRSTVSLLAQPVRRTRWPGVSRLARV